LHAYPKEADNQTKAKLPTKRSPLLQRPQKQTPAAGSLTARDISDYRFSYRHQLPGTLRE
jgi:hypothetical protein